MALSFPPIPNLNQTYVSGTRSWKWNGYAWDAILTVLAPTSGINVGVSGGALLSSPTNVIFGSDTEVLNVKIEGSSNGVAKLIHSITGATGTTLEHDLPSNHFSNLSGDTDGYGRQFLVLKDDGDVGFEYIKIQDVFKNSDFVFDVTSLRLGNQTSKNTLIGTAAAGTTLSDLGPSFAVAYAGSPSPLPVSARISSSSFVDTTEYDLSDPYTTLSTSGLYISYPSESDDYINITVRGTGSDGVSGTANFVLNFPNYAYFGSGVQNITGSLLSSSGFTAELKTGTDLGNGVTINYNVAPNNYAYFAYPTSRGINCAVALFISENESQSVTDNFQFETYSHTNEYGFEEDYQIVRSSQASLAEVKLIFTVTE
jgi:hypothetical protein